MKRIAVFSIALAVTVALLVSVSCDKKNNPISKFQPEITNITDNFQFQITNANDVTTSIDYDWRNTGATASINQSCAITAGTASLTIFDSTGASLYTRNLADNGTFPSTAGLPGIWKIRVALTNFDGTINFRVQKL